MNQMKKQLLRTAKEIKEEDMVAVIPHEPTPYVKNHLKRVRDLGNGKVVYIFDNVGFLSGSGGIFLIEDGKIIKQKMCYVA